MHAYFPPADAAAPAAAGAGEAADGSDQRTAALPAGAPAPPQAAASGPEVAMPSYQPWKQSRPEWKGCTAEQWAASRCKTDDYIAPTMPKVLRPARCGPLASAKRGRLLVRSSGAAFARRLDHAERWSRAASS